jgi:hypothetical protein
MCGQIVSLYRNENSEIVKLWAECDRALRSLNNRVTTPTPLGHHSAVYVNEKGIVLPNGLIIEYKDLELSEGKYSYTTRQGPRSIWGGAVVENVVQALARIIIADQLIEISEKYKVVLTVHDSIVVLVPDSEVDTAKSEINRIMSTSPAWCATLPLACEVKSGKRYGSLKS